MHSDSASRAVAESIVAGLRVAPVATETTGPAGVLRLMSTRIRCELAWARRTLNKYALLG
jgi:hypothetical protein